MRSKHCDTSERSVWTAWGTMLKNKLCLITFYEFFCWPFYITKIYLHKQFKQISTPCLVAISMLEIPLRIISKRVIWPVDGTLIGTTTPCQSGPESNGNEVVTPHFIELQNWNLMTGYSLESYPVRGIHEVKRSVWILFLCFLCLTVNKARK